MSATTVVIWQIATLIYLLSAGISLVWVTKLAWAFMKTRPGDIWWAGCAITAAFVVLPVFNSVFAIMALTSHFADDSDEPIP